jgi:1-acyl-sn-glycerol-3-phosphate acyltransferase
VSGWSPVAPCTVEMCVGPARVLAGMVRRAARLAGAVLVVLAGVSVALVARRMRSHWRLRMTMAWARLLLRVLGVRVLVRSALREPLSLSIPDVGRGTASLIVANHVSWLDPLVLAAVLPCRMLAKREVATWPVVRGLAAGADVLLIDRERLKPLPETVRRIADALAEGWSVAAFPEGTTWCGRGMGRFRPAVFEAAVAAGVAVRPVALRYVETDGALSGAPAYVGDDSLLDSLLRVIAVRRMVVEVTMLPLVTVPAGEGPPRRRLARAAEVAVATVAAPSPVGADRPVGSLHFGHVGACGPSAPSRRVSGRSWS